MTQTQTETKSLVDFCLETGYGFEVDSDKLLTLTGEWIEPEGGIVLRLPATIELLADTPINRGSDEMGETVGHDDGDTLYAITDADGDSFRLAESAGSGASGAIWEFRPAKFDLDTLELLFDNGGGILLQSNPYCHSYDNGADAARDVKSILDGADPTDWDNNMQSDEGQHALGCGPTRNEYDWDLADKHCSDTHHYNLADLRAAMADTEPLTTSGYSETDFLRALTGRKHIDDVE